MENQIRIKFPASRSGSYIIRIDKGLDPGRLMAAVCPADRYAVITDSNVRELHGKKLAWSLSKAGLAHDFFEFPAGEKNKNLENFGSLSEKMLIKGFDRGSAVIAFGGGVPGDLAGFIAGSFMRGIPFIQVPTTLLAMCDSSVGGKVAVDLKSGKNSSGLFYQPKAVLIDTDFLDTLSETEFNNGMFEVIKHGVILDEKYFRFIEENVTGITGRDPAILRDLISGSCRIKAAIVMKDEKESGLRKVLNFGHTVGHGLEGLSHYRTRHGFAVAAGMTIEAQASVQTNLLQPEDLNRIKALLVRFGMKFPTYNPVKLMDHIIKDKKNTRSQGSLRIPLVLPVRIGRTVIRNFSPEEILRFLKLPELFEGSE
jgi:3-dehydroquinate synthase